MTSPCSYRPSDHRHAGRLLPCRRRPGGGRCAGGVRYVDAKTNVDITPSPRGLGRQIEESAGSTNGILGVRAVVPLGDKWSLMGYLDVGEGNSTSSWQAIAGASYQYSPTTSFKLGYRHLDYKRDNALLDKAAMGVCISVPDSSSEDRMETSAPRRCTVARRQV